MGKIAGIFILSIMLLGLRGCFPFRDSPYSDQLIRGERNLNAKTLQRMQNADPEADGVVRVAIFADSHQNYDDLAAVIDQINRIPAIDFVINLGDFTNSAYNFEYDQFLEYWSRLEVPGFTVAGNHDLLGAGAKIFQAAFGETNFIYETASYRFVFGNANNWEDPKGFQPEWIAQSAEQSGKRTIVATHEPLTDPERFHGEVAAQLQRALDSPKTQLAICGHRHIFDIDTGHAAKMLYVPRVQGANWILLELHPDKMTITAKPVEQTWTYSPRSS